MSELEQQQFGQAGIEADQGYFPIGPDTSKPPAPDAEPPLAESIDNWANDHDRENIARQPVERAYQKTDGPDRGERYDEKGTVPIDRAARDLTEARELDEALVEFERTQKLAEEIDQARGFRPDLDAQQQTGQPVAQPEQQSAQPHNDGLDGVDPEVAAAFRNPKILNVLSQHYSASEAQVAAAQTQAEAQTSAAIQQAADWSRQNAEIVAAAILARPELQGIAPGQLGGAIQALATANPQAAEQIRQQLGQVQVLAQQAQEAQRVQQQRAATQFQQIAAQHDAEFDRQSAASGESVEQRNEVARYATQMLRDSGMSDQQILWNWNNNPMLRSVQGQQVLADAARWRMARAGIANKVAPKPIPHVVKPGSSVDRPDAPAAPISRWKTNTPEI